VLLCGSDSSSSSCCSNRTYQQQQHVDHLHAWLWQAKVGPVDNGKCTTHETCSVELQLFPFVVLYQYPRVPCSASLTRALLLYVTAGTWHLRC
jgi:hypothetical protein